MIYWYVVFEILMVPVIFENHPITIPKKLCWCQGVGIDFDWFSVFQVVERHAFAVNLAKTTTKNSTKRESPKAKNVFSQAV